ncbi:type II toxin-antitoxin system VapB family antitoxin [Pseudomonas chlororaphis]|uniref:type II toxin-antitoxin system VapB family antitoxin n=1 Tax=Pseudomonas chlororaphis TaxID=587753 RepID=UPI0006A61BE7|nr:type II toxin-antitoxin system VapB family antitoxin [Pseudomonas chlororaphis]AZC33215.1 VapB protein (antitoxin to VapC) [Pseudomonas chlororaphis subsp. piscium]WDG76182.1 type II toxin-antitoxin system VapB family antitoxin [Pseudomonas chlororaphis]WDG84579.1 type II toxin-antitoxin system VapB family antitoxin [Pseudomonas chlororaphis]WDG90889.1 type II toxin-antitoxin system VapB family antitoxin [Pseudomonas chlororaphis]SDS38226.1 antitoxin VapB [Pseudomonas chlororaphis]
MAQGSLFKSSGGQTIHLPQALTFPDDVTQVEIIAIGRSRIIAPVGEAWDSWFDQASVSEDFMMDRGQPTEPEHV